MKRLAQLMDFQRFAQNPRLAAIIADTENRYAQALSDEDLDWVNAAGTAALPAAQPDKLPNEG